MALTRKLCAAVALCAALSVCAAAQEVRGRVLDPDGAPARGAVVRLCYVHDSTGFAFGILARTNTNALGDFRLPLPKLKPPATAFGQPVGECLLVATSPGYGLGATYVEPGKNTGYKVELCESQDITCKVIDKERPIGGAAVSVMYASRWPSLALPISRTRRAGIMCALSAIYHAETDDRGEAVLRDVPKSPVLLRVDDEVRAQWSAIGVGGVTGTTCTVKMSRPMGMLEGTVSSEETAKPVKGLLVVAGRGTGASANTVLTDAVGAFKVSSVSLSGLGRAILLVDPAPEPEWAAKMVSHPIGGDWTAMGGKAAFEAIDQAKEDLWDVRWQVAAGKAVKCRVIDTKTEQPMPGAAIRRHMTLEIPRKEDGEEARPLTLATMFYRFTDAEGMCCFRVPEKEEIKLQLVGAPGGWVMNTETPMQAFEVKEDETLIEFRAEFLPELSLRLITELPVGEPKQRCNAFIYQPEAQRSRKVTTDQEGMIGVTGLVKGPALLYATSEDGRFARYQTVDLTASKCATPLLMSLRRAQKGLILLQDQEGNGLEGAAYVTMENEEGVRWAWIQRSKQTRIGKVEVGGLLPGLEYRVYGHARGRKPTWRGDSVRWSVGPGEDEPTIILKFTQ